MNFHIISSSFTFPYLISRVNQVPLDLTGDPTSIIYYGAGAITIGIGINGNGCRTELVTGRITAKIGTNFFI